MAKFYFDKYVCVTTEDKCLNVESLNDIEKFFSKKNWIHKCYINNLYVKVLDGETDFKYGIYANIFENKMMNHFIGYSDSMLKYKE